MTQKKIDLETVYLIQSNGNTSADDYRRVEVTTVYYDNPFDKGAIVGPQEEKQQGYFHGWCHEQKKAGEFSYGGPSAIVEYDDGTVGIVRAEWIRFLEPLSTLQPSVNSVK